jgi:ABC-type transport system involved in multi-copper enzyme maturation permease subunit
MLIYKTWLDTRWRFLIGFALLLMMAFGAIIEYPTVVKLMPVADKLDTSGPFGQAIRDAVDVQRTFRGYVWHQWISQNLSQMFTLFAVLLGSGGLLAQASGGAAQFTLSLPISRNEVLWTRIGVCLVELLGLALLPFLVIPLMAPAIGQSYSVFDALIHGAFVFAAGTIFFSLAIFLSTLFADIWRPLLITCAVAIVLNVAEQVAGVGIFHVMSAETFLRANTLPWIGALTSITVSAALLYGATTNFARQDF